MNHQQLVQEWKDRFGIEFKSRGKGFLLDKKLINFMERLSLAAAKKAAEAQKPAKIHGRGTINDELQLHYDEGFNAAISQSERQLTDYFNDI